jgi:hypothetical protein
MDPAMKSATADSGGISDAIRFSTRYVLWSLLCGASLAHAATKVRIDANKDPDLCERFRKALLADHVMSMTREQMCRYSFDQRNDDDHYFQKLEWRPVAGDPVAMTMKIFEANVPPHDVETPANVAKDRARTLRYAKQQNEHGALVVEVAPYTMTQLTLPATFTQVAGYVLRSRGTYCGPGKEEVANKRSELIAYFSDKALSKPLPISGSLIGNVDEPIRIGTKYYVASIGDASLWSNWNPPGRGPIYSMYLSEFESSYDHSQLFMPSVCSFTYEKEAL